jgi:Vitamin K-dependent gamma-carboxylase
MYPLRRLLAFMRRAACALEEWFLGPADPRSYASVRIAYAFAALCTLLDYWPLRLTLLADTGFFGGADRTAPWTTLNVFRFSSAAPVVTAVFIVSGFAMVLLALGFLPRLMAFVVYVWTLSYADTAQTALSGFDTILRVVGFVLVIGPHVPTWSIGPSWARGGNTRPARWALRLVQWQLMLIYVCTVWLKAPDEFWRRGEAITYFMMSMFARYPSSWFSHHVALGGVLTYGTLLIEASLPWLLWMRKTRMFGVLIGAGLHVGIGVSAKLALFTLAMAPLYLSFFEAADFEWLSSLWPPSAIDADRRRT